MAEPTPGTMPGPPPGFQRPGVAGAGNILDPEVRGGIREQLHEAVHDAVQQARGGEPRPQAEAPAAPVAAALPAQPAQYRAGPFPHGDVDLRGFAANVPQGPVRPERSRVRRYYFLQPGDGTTRDEPPPAPALQASPGPKPG